MTQRVLFLCTTTQPEARSPRPCAISWERPFEAFIRRARGPQVPPLTIPRHGRARDRYLGQRKKTLDRCWPALRQVIHRLRNARRSLPGLYGARERLSLELSRPSKATGTEQSSSPSTARSRHDPMRIEQGCRTPSTA